MVVETVQIGGVSQPRSLIPGNGRPRASVGGITLLTYLAAEIFIRTVVRKYFIRVNHHIL